VVVLALALVVLVLVVVLAVLVALVMGVVVVVFVMRHCRQQTAPCSTGTGFAAPCLARARCGAPFGCRRVVSPKNVSLWSRCPTCVCAVGLWRVSEGVCQV
jgi:hypothetical protein